MNKKRMNRKTIPVKPTKNQNNNGIVAQGSHAWSPCIESVEVHNHNKISQRLEVSLKKEDNMMNMMATEKNTGIDATCSAVVYHF